MKQESHPWKWSEGPVDRHSDHFEIRYSDASNTDSDGWPLVALVGKSGDGTLNVEFLLDRADPENIGMIKAVENDLNFYVVEKHEPNPWNYLRYHCGTTANIYSNVHWSFHSAKSPKHQ